MNDYTLLYYSTPVQLKFYSVQQKKWIGGIGYLDKLIDGYSGCVFLLDDVIKEAQQDNIVADDAIIELSWISLSSEILGN